MIKYSHDKGLKTDFSTNGMLIARYVGGLVESGLDRILFAIDGSTQEVQQKYRVGSDLEEIKQNIRGLVEARDRSKGKFPKVIAIQTVVSSSNESQIQDLTDMADSLGVDSIRFKSLAINLGGEYLQGEEEQKELLPKNKDYIRKGSDILLCPALGDVVILYNGEVSLCCSDFLGRYIAGNILKENSFEKVVYGKRYNNFRKKILKKELPICKDCAVTGLYWIPGISKKFNK